MKNLTNEGERWQRNAQTIRPQRVEQMKQRNGGVSLCR